LTALASKRPMIAGRSEAAPKPGKLGMSGQAFFRKSPGPVRGQADVLVGGRNAALEHLFHQSRHGVAKEFPDVLGGFGQAHVLPELGKQLVFGLGEGSACGHEHPLAEKGLFLSCPIAQSRAEG
jgi:hypothetical protein